VEAGASGRIGLDKEGGAMLNVICFYWLGDRWEKDGWAEGYINRLQSAVKRNLTLDHKFICFTNEDLRLRDGIEVRSFDIPIKAGVLPRMYMFSESAGLFGNQVLALDLDVVIVGNLDDIGGYNGVFASRSKFAPGQQHKLDGDVTSFLAGRVLEDQLWSPLLNCPKEVMRITGGRERYWFRHRVGNIAARWDKKCPGQVVSYKRHVRANGNRVPNGARIVSCHGKPRPHEIMDQPWIEEHWR
jgi:hypothetical protein